MKIVGGRASVIPMLGFLTLAVAASALFVGPTPGADPLILWEIRLPRVILGMLVGFALSGTGAIFQGLLRNPLADPYVLGTSSGAALGAMVGLQFRAWFPESVLISTFLFYFMIFLGAFSATLAAYLIARTEGRVSVVNLLLAGVIVSTFCGALILLFFSLQNRDSFSMFFFLMGSLIEGNWNLIGVSLTVTVVGLGIAMFYARELNILSLGEEKARSLGVNVERLKLLLFGLGALVVSAAVAVSGTIGFIGLIVPHMARLLIGPENKRLIPASALLGGIVLMLTDGLARTVAAPVEIPVGIVTSMLGAPFFLWLLKRRAKERYF